VKIVILRNVEWRVLWGNKNCGIAFGNLVYVCKIRHILSLTDTAHVFLFIQREIWILLWRWKAIRWKTNHGMSERELEKSCFRIYTIIFKSTISFSKITGWWILKNSFINYISDKQYSLILVVWRLLQTNALVSVMVLDSLVQAKDPADQ